MRLRVHIKAEDQNFGMYNVWTYLNYMNAPLCQFRLE